MREIVRTRLPANAGTSLVQQRMIFVIKPHIIRRLMRILQEIAMRNPILAALVAASTAMPLAAQAQQRIIVEEGVTTGLSGPGIGIINDDERPRFRRYIVEERVPSYSVETPVQVGTVLPEAGVTYYDVPQQFGATSYRYTVVNDRPLLVEPRTRRVMQVID